ncbi:MAG: hypothetical protein ACOZAO_01095 [Patescibacteria group bacterium]
MFTRTNRNRLVLVIGVILLVLIAGFSIAALEPFKVVLNYAQGMPADQLLATELPAFLNQIVSLAALVTVLGLVRGGFEMLVQMPSPEIMRAIIDLNYAFGAISGSVLAFVMSLVALLLLTTKD